MAERSATAHPKENQHVRTRAVLQLPSPQSQPITPDQERTWGTISHVVPLVAMVLSAGTLGFVGSLVIYLIYKDKGPFVRAHAANSLNIQIITGIILIISIPLMFVLIGFVTFAIALVFAFVLHLIGAIKANNGDWWNPPHDPALRALTYHPGRGAAGIHLPPHRAHALPWLPCGRSCSLPSRVDEHTSTRLPLVPEGFFCALDPIPPT